MRLRYSLPLYAIFPSGGAVLMLFAVLAIFNWLGFTHCWTWTRLPSLPRKAVGIVDAFGYRVYLQTDDEQVYCYKDDHWADCLRSPYPPQLQFAPDWLRSNFVSIPVTGTVIQLLRVNHFLDATYYALSDSGDVLVCPASMESQIVNMFRSGAIVLLLIPLGLAVWGFAAFMNIFIKQANPVYWDFFGRGTRIK